MEWFYRILLYVIDKAVAIEDHSNSSQMSNSPSPHTGSPEENKNSNNGLLELPNFVLEQLDSYAEQQHISRTDAISTLIEHFQKSQGTPKKSKQSLLNELKALQQNVKSST